MRANLSNCLENFGMGRNFIFTPFHFQPFVEQFLEVNCPYKSTTGKEA